MTQLPAPARRSSRARRTALVLATTAALVSVAGPARADVPEGWSDPDKPDGFFTFFLIVGAPVLLALIITLLVVLPALIRGEGLTDRPKVVENQWLGGPRKTTAELAGPDSDDSQAGGASARW